MNIENELHYLTKRYWKQGSKVEDYIDELLPKEVEYLKNQKKINVKHAEVLVQLVGYSWEPLLLSVCAYQPEIIVPVLNECYGEQEGKAHGDKFKENIEKLKKKKLIDNDPKICQYPTLDHKIEFETVEETPEEVFKFLKKRVLPLINEGKKVVVDITGAKKSMVSGAYLFSSYAKTMVSYVNYKKYNQEFGKPYGYTCKIDQLENPFELFKLREWDRVQYLYEHYAFRSAIELIKDIKTSTKSYFENDELDSITILEKWLEFYRLWDDGDYGSSLTKLKDIGSETILFPTAVEKLGSELWKKVTNYREIKSNFIEMEGLNGINKSIYIKDEEILVYAYDELEKIKRLINYNEDFRSALLRAAGLNEVLLKARVVRLWVNNQIFIDINGSIFNNRGILNNHDNYLMKEIDKELLGYSGASYLMRFLQEGESPYIGLGKIKINQSESNKRQQRLESPDQFDIKLYLSQNAPHLNKFWQNIKSKEMNLKGVFILRNKAIHFCLSIPENLAKGAASIAEENLKDFQKEWTTFPLSDGIYKAMNWNELCKVCKITFLPK